MRGRVEQFLERNADRVMGLECRYDGVKKCNTSLTPQISKRPTIVVFSLIVLKTLMSFLLLSAGCKLYC